MGALAVCCVAFGRAWLSGLSSIDVSIFSPFHPQARGSSAVSVAAQQLHGDRDDVFRFETELSI
jgi:hypothetical protein